MLQEPVHVDVGQQWTCDAALRRPARVSLAATHAPGSVRVPFLDRRPQPHLDEAQDVSIHDTPGLLTLSDFTRRTSRPRRVVRYCAGLGELAPYRNK
jgi:hypothetical protein